MGKFLNKFKSAGDKITNKVEMEINKPKTQGYGKLKKKRDSGNGMFEEFDDYDDNDDFRDSWDVSDEVGIQPAQKSESFHHFILENQYKDLERSIRGLKDVWNKDTQQWVTKRKKLHCFTDEEAEDILRTAQSHLATDIKLGWIKKESFGLYMDALYKELAFLFETIAEYRYGRYNNKDGSLNYERQYEMKVQNQKIFLELWVRVQANYSRSINGSENKLTHEGVRGQESLQRTDKLEENNRSYS